MIHCFLSFLILKSGVLNGYSIDYGSGGYGKGALYIHLIDYNFINF
nr:hypothetical protein BSM_23740 [uncultured archaeon]